MGKAMKPVNWWAAVSPRGVVWTAMRTKSQVIRRFTEGFHPEVPQAKWRHWYRLGWRLVPVVVSPRKKGKKP